MSDDKLAPVLRSWLQGRDLAPPDSNQSAKQVMARVPRTRQRGRWWPLSIFRHASSTPRTTADTERQPTLDIPIHGQLSNVKWGTMTMFSPAKAIMAGALVFAVGGVLLVGQPFHQQSVSVPGQQASPAGSLDLGDRTLILAVSDDFTTSQAANITYDGDIAQWRDMVYLYELQATDARLDGTLEANINFDMRPDGSATMWGTETLTNDGGTWEGPWTGVIASDGTNYVLQTLLGTGEYEGYVLKWQTHFDEPSAFSEPGFGTVSTGWIAPLE